jgi:hypothetical protein
MLFQNLRALCLVPGRPGSIWNHLGALVRSTGVSGRFACCFRTDLHFADVRHAQSNRIVLERLPVFPMAEMLLAGDSQQTQARPFTKKSL